MLEPMTVNGVTCDVIAVMYVVLSRAEKHGPCRALIRSRKSVTL
jgi:hypothetical protein